MRCQGGLALQTGAASGDGFWHYSTDSQTTATRPNGENDVTDYETVQGLAKRLAQAIPQNIRTAGEDIERNFRTVLKSGLDKMNLVSREEFDVQAAVLARTRAKLESLEKSLAMLEAQAVKPAAGKKARKKTAKKTTRKAAKKTADD